MCYIYLIFCDQFSNPLSSLEPKDILTLFGLIVTIILSSFSLYVSLATNKNTNYINSVTSSRIKWIENLRNNISEYVGLIKHYAFSLREPRHEEKANELRQRVYILNNIIILQLNTAGILDKAVINAVEKIMKLTDPVTFKDGIELNEAIEDVVSKTGDLLKFEWERVKEESKKGNLSDEQLNELQIKWDSKKNKPKS